MTVAPTKDHPALHPSPDALSARECEVLDLVASGWSNQGIADALFCSTKTVEHHITAIHRKLGISDHPGTNRRVAAVLLWTGAARSARDVPLTAARDRDDAQ